MAPLMGPAPPGTRGSTTTTGAGALSDLTITKITASRELPTPRSPTNQGTRKGSLSCCRNL
eukprot:16169880-Heterocapsa_arctica.AAC.1